MYSISPATKLQKIFSYGSAINCTVYGSTKIKKIPCCSIKKFFTKKKMPRQAAIYIRIGAANAVLTEHAGTGRSPV
jgi:hypothetical protein